MQVEYFNPQFESLLRGGAARRVYAVLKAREIAGMNCVDRAGPAGLVDRDRQ